MSYWYIYSIFVEFGGHIFQQIIGILIGTNCALVDLFPYSYESYFIQNIIKDKITNTRTRPLISNPGILMMFCLLIIQTLITGIPLIYSQRTWDKGHNINSFLCLISWHFQPMVNFLPYFITKKTTSILPFEIFHTLNSNKSTTPAYGVFILQF